MCSSGFYRPGSPGLYHFPNFYRYLEGKPESMGIKKWLFQIRVSRMEKRFVWLLDHLEAAGLTKKQRRAFFKQFFRSAGYCKIRMKERKA